MHNAKGQPLKCSIHRNMEKSIIFGERALYFGKEHYMLEKSIFFGKEHYILGKKALYFGKEHYMLDNLDIGLLSCQTRKLIS